MQRIYCRYVKGIPFVMEHVRKGNVTFSVKNGIKVRVWTSTQSLPKNNFQYLSRCPPGFDAYYISYVQYVSQIYPAIIIWGQKMTFIDFHQMKLLIRSLLQIL